MDWTHEGRASSGLESNVSFTVPNCDSRDTIICFRDTAYVHEEPGYSVPVLGADWLLFGTARDSIEIHATPDETRGKGRAFLSTNLGHEKDASRTTAPYFRIRLPNDVAIAVWVDLDRDLGDSVAYAFRINRVGPRAAGLLRATGQSATLTISSAGEADTFTVVPASVPKRGRDLSKWVVFARKYKIALVADSLYEICRIPCSAPDIVKLTPGANIVKRY